MVRRSLRVDGTDGVSTIVGGGVAVVVTGDVAEIRETMVEVVFGRGSSLFEDSELDPWTIQNCTK